MVQLTPEEVIKAKWGTRWGCHTPVALSPGKRNGTFCTGSWAGPGPVWMGAENITTNKIQSPDHPACSESLRQWYQFQINNNTRVYSWHKASCCVHEELFPSRQEPKMTNLSDKWYLSDRLCGLVVRVSGYIQRSRVRFPALPDFLSSSGSGTGSTQPREVNWGATWIKSSGSGLENRH